MYPSPTDPPAGARRWRARHRSGRLAVIAAVAMMTSALLSAAPVSAAAAPSTVPDGCAAPVEPFDPGAAEASCVELTASAPPRVGSTSYALPSRYVAPPDLGPDPEGDPGPAPDAGEPPEPTEPQYPPDNICQTNPDYQDRFITCDDALPVIRIFRTDNPSLTRGRVFYKIVETIKRNNRSGVWQGVVTVSVLRTEGEGSAETLFAALSVNCGSCRVITISPTRDVVPFSGSLTMRYQLESTGTGSRRRSDHTATFSLTRANTTGTVSDSFFRAKTRCDTEISRTEGCVNDALIPTFRPTQAIAPSVFAHIRFAQANLPDRWGLKGSGRPLNRWKADPATKNRNRKYTCYGLRKPPGTSCDEYPFASTSQNGGVLRDRSRFSVRAVPELENRVAGIELLAFYGIMRILDGEAYWVDTT